MTLLEFAQSRELDWLDVYNFLKDNGATPPRDPQWVIESDWLNELKKEFLLQDGVTEIEVPLDEQETFASEEEPQGEPRDDAKAPPNHEELDPTKIDVDPKQFTLDIIIRRLENDEILLDPEFQRRGNIWDKKRQSRLIESILIKLPIPAFYFDASDESKWVIVDGLQRINTIKNFIVDKKLKLSDLEYLTEWNGKDYNDLPRQLHRRIQETVIFAFLIKPGTPVTLKYNIFKRINTGGLFLTPQEIRHALNQGTPANLLRDLAELEVFHCATDHALEKSKRMDDRDFINRFVAFFLLGYENYQKSEERLDGFLNQGMAAITDNNKAEIEAKFSQAMKTAFEIFETDAFRKRYDYPPEKKRKPLNKALFDVWAVCLAQLSEAEQLELITKKEEVRKLSAELLMTDKVFETSITTGTGDVNRVRNRFKKIHSLIQTILNNQ
jgi:hypothetical protein